MRVATSSSLALAVGSAAFTASQSPAARITELAASLASCIVLVSAPASPTCVPRSRGAGVGVSAVFSPPLPQASAATIARSGAIRRRLGMPRIILPPGLRSRVAMELERIELQTDGPVARVWLNRPDARNAFDGRMVSELRKMLFDLGTLDAVRVIVLGGRGACFCAGADVNWMKA